MSGGIFEQDRRPTRGAAPGRNLGHLQFRVHGDRNAPELTQPLQLVIKSRKSLYCMNRLSWGSRRSRRDRLERAF